MASLAPTSDPKPPDSGPIRRKRGRPRGTTAADSLSEARRRKEWALAHIREAELKKRLDEQDLVVEREWQAILRMVQAGMLAVTSRFRARVPHLSASDAAILDEEIRAVLTLLSEDRAPT
jgi:hypothetical protein